MTDSLAPADPYTTAFESRVTAVTGQDVQLESTYFYPEGGGQPADRGTLGGVEVVDVQEDDGVVHTLAEEPDFGAGDDVRGEIDEAFRTYCMRAHTASHVLYGAGRRLLDDLGYGGFGITAAPRGEQEDQQNGDDVVEKVRVDFETTTDIDDAILVELERLVNRVVWDSLPVSWDAIPTEEAKSRKEVAFNVATEEGAMAGSDTVRIVTIGDESMDEGGDTWDVAACGGTHVRNTTEIGPVRVLERSNPGEGMTRVEFAVGPTAIRRQAKERQATLDAARTAGTGVTDLPAAVKRLQENVNEARTEIAALKDEVLDARLEGFDSVEKDGATWLVGSVDGFDANEVGDRIQDLAGEEADVIAVSGGDSRAFVVVASAGDVDANEVVQSVTEKFSGGGGGSPTFAQGGGLDARPAEVAAWLRED